MRKIVTITFPCRGARNPLGRKPSMWDSRPSFRSTITTITGGTDSPEPYAMKIHEYQAKELLASAGANTPKHIVVRSAEEAAAAFDQLSTGGGVMVKAQIHAGGRGAGQLLGYPEKFGGVKFAASRDKAKAIAETMLKFP